MTAIRLGELVESLNRAADAAALDGKHGEAAQLREAAIAITSLLAERDGQRLALTQIEGSVQRVEEQRRHLVAERDALRRTLADLASSDPFAAHAEGDHAMAYENNAENLRLRSRITSLLGVVEAAQQAAVALDGEIEQHEAFFIQSEVVKGTEWGEVHRSGIAAAKRDLAALQLALSVLSKEGEE